MDSPARGFVENSPAKLLVGFSSHNVILAAIAGWLVYLPLAAAIARSNRRGVVIGGIAVYWIGAICFLVEMRGKALEWNAARQFERP